jgi:glycerophosphoryl diester phosphodiesterase
VNGARPIVIAHRGASGYRPEHTLAAYELAIDQGADFIEPDLVSTRDHVLVARHENAIHDTTDVAAHPEFANRRATKVVDNVAITGWFTEDFTLAELKSLRVRERIPATRPQNVSYDGRYEVPTLQEILDLVNRRNAELGRNVGLYPETKHPAYFASLGLSLEEPLLELLNLTAAPVFIQSFEAENLRKLRGMTTHPLIQLFSTRDWTRSPRLRQVAEYAGGIGPEKRLVIPRQRSGEMEEPTRLVEDAHRAGLLVHCWTFRNEDMFLPADCRGNPLGEYERFFRAGVDGVFSDHPDTAIAARNKLT